MKSAIFTQPRTKVTDVITIQVNFSSYAGKDQRRRWNVHTSESGQRKSVTAATVAGGRRASRPVIVADDCRQKDEPGLTLALPLRDSLD